MADTAQPYWYSKRLDEMTDEEWESLCDGCGRCCLNKIINDDTDEMFETLIACKLLDTHTCRCKDYKNRLASVPDCVRLTLKDLPDLFWLPDTCAYRLLHQGCELPEWHPLISGTQQTVYDSGYSVQDKVFSENDVPDPDDWHEYVIRLIDEPDNK